MLHAAAWLNQRHLWPCLPSITHWRDQEPLWVSSGPRRPSLQPEAPTSPLPSAQASLHSAPGSLLQCWEASRACMHSRSRGMAADHRSGGSPGECHTPAGLDLALGGSCSPGRRAGGTTAHAAATCRRCRWLPRLTALTFTVCRPSDSCATMGTYVKPAGAVGCSGALLCSANASCLSCWRACRLPSLPPVSVR